MLSSLPASISTRSDCQKPNEMLLKTLLVLLLVIIKLSLAMPPNDKALFDSDSEDRTHKKRRRPCGGRNAPQGRTFFDWSFQHVDVNYNYNINCGGGGSGGHGGQGGGQKPILSGLLQQGGANNQKPLLSGLLQGVGNRPLGGGNTGPVQFIQSQFQGLTSNGQGLGSLLPQGDGLSSWLPQGGLFSGQGISSLFENGLFSGIFDNRPSTPTVTTSKPDVSDPDVIYNDEKPVHEDHDDVVPDQYSKPGQYFVASNPVFGDFVYDLSASNRNRINRQFNREINRLTNFFGR